MTKITQFPLAIEACAISVDLTITVVQLCFLLNTDWCSVLSEYYFPDRRIHNAWQTQAKIAFKANTNSNFVACIGLEY